MGQMLYKSHRDPSRRQGEQDTAESSSLDQTDAGTDVDPIHWTGSDVDPVNWKEDDGTQHLAVSLRRQQQPQQRATNTTTTTVLGDVNVAIGSGGGTVSSEETDWKLESAREVFVQTDRFQKVQSKLKEHGHVTILGASGEGKTSMALMLGAKYKEKGFDFVFVDNIDKFELAACVKDGQPLFIVFDDLFGTGSSTEISNLRKMLTSLDEFIKHLTRSSEKKKKMTRQQLETGKDRPQGLRGVGPVHDVPPQLDGKQHLDLYILFTSKSYNFQEVIPRLGGQQFNFFEPQTVIDVTKTLLYQYSVDEKKAIFRKHQQSKGLDVQVDLDQICSSKDGLFGFPMTCSLYCNLHYFQSDPVQFFLKPLSYLRQEIDQIMGSKSKISAALILMVLYNDKLDLRKLETKSDDQRLEANLQAVETILPGITRADIYESTKTLRGTFLLSGDTTAFSHPSILDACLCSVYNLHPTLVLTNCSMQFLYERVNSHSVPATEIDNNSNIIFVSENYYDVIAARIAESVLKGEFRWSISHPLLQNEPLAEKVLQDPKIKQWAKSGDFLSTDGDDKCFIYWAVLSKSEYLVETVIKLTHHIFSGNEIKEALNASILSGSIAVMKILFTVFEDRIPQNTVSDLFLDAAEKGHTGMVTFLLEKGADITKTNPDNDNIFHVAARSKNIAIMNVALKFMKERNLVDGRNRKGTTPIMAAALTGFLDAFSRLLANKANLTLVDDKGKGVLHYSCEGGNTSIVEHLIKICDINERDSEGRTPVMVAARCGQKDVFDLLVSNAANLTLVDDNDDCVLHYACQGGNTSIVEHLITVCDINKTGRAGRTPLMMSAKCGQKDVFDLLVSKAADLTLVDDDGDCVLLYACQGGNTSIVQHLITVCDINKRGGEGHTPVMMAALCGQKDVFDLLVSNVAELTLVDDDDDCVLHYACYGGNTSIVQHLITVCDINKRGRDGRTPVMSAALCGQKDVFDLLVSNAADLTLVDDDDDFVLLYACQGGNTSIIQHLITVCDINKRGGEGRTPVMSAALFGQKDVFDLLVSNAADLTLVNDTGDCVLHYACQGGNTSIVQHLITVCDINKRGRDGRTPVMSAALCGQKDVFDLLVSNAADLTLVDDDDDCVLHYACQGGNTSIVHHLITVCDINKRGRDGRTPVMSAALFGQKDVFDLLVSNAADFTLVDDDDDCVLLYACQGGNTSIVQHLITVCDINKTGRDGRTPVMSAALFGQKDVFDLLVSNAADLTLVDDKDDCVLHYACKGGNTSIVLHLIRVCDINKRGQEGRTPVMVAAWYVQKDVFDLLVYNAADLTLVDDNDNCVLHYACQGGNTSIVQHLITVCDINTRGRDGRTPVMSAALFGQKNVFDLLVSNAADLILVDDDDDCVLLYACQGGNTSIVQHLITVCDINTRGRDGRTPVMSAALFGQKDVFDLLVSNAADLTLVDDKDDCVLHYACKGGNTSIVQHLITVCDINKRGQEGCTPVMVAALFGQKDVFDLLVSNGDYLTLVDDNDNCVLHYACQGGNTSIVQHLITVCDINKRGRDGRTPVMSAALFGQKDVFDLLVSNAADLTLVDDKGDCVLHYACKGGNTSIVQHLITVCDINKRGQEGRTPVMVAAWFGQKDVFDLLVSNAADLTLVDDKGDCVLHYACKGGNTSIVQHLITVCDINKRGREGRTPMMVAAWYGQKDVFDLLVSNAADLTLVDDNDNCVLHYVCKGGNTSIVQHLITVCDINKRGRDGRTPVMVAALFGQKDVFDLLVSNAADLTLVNDKGDCVLHYACQGGNTSIVQHLITVCDINTRGRDGRTPVMSAALFGQKDVFDLLVSNAADLTLVDDKGDCVLHYACKGGNTSIVQHLITVCDINKRGRDRRTPVMSAALFGQKDVFDLLVSNAADLTLVDDYYNCVLRYACQGGNTSIVQHLITVCDINKRGGKGQTPVMTAAVCGQKDVFDLLVSNAADLTLVDGDDDCVLHYACQGGNTSIVQHLITVCDINKRGREGRNPVMSAALCGQKDVFDLLVSKAADLTLVDDKDDCVLHYAWKGGNTSIVQHLTTVCDINTRGQEGRTRVMVAALCGQKDVFDLLVSNAADLTLVDDNDNCALHYACQGGNTSIVQHLITVCDINKRGRDGRTPVMSAALFGQKDVFDLLVSNAADLTLVDDKGDCVLHYACKRGNTSIVQHLITVCDINTRGQEGRIPVMVAAWFGQKDVFDLLVSNAADLTLVDDKGDCVLHYACKRGNTSIVQHLITVCDINKRGQEGRTPVMVAAWYGQKDVFDLLVSNAADLTLVDDKGDCVLHYACKGGNTSIVQHLITVCDINKRRREGRTPMIVAAWYGQKDVFDLLVSNAADLTLVDDNDNCVLHYACKGGNTSIVQHLITVCDINKRGRDGRTPVMSAALFGQKDVFDLLVSNAADLTLVNDKGDCVLHCACQGGNTSIVQHLITVCDINTRGRDGRTPVMSAALFGQKDVFDLLVSNAADLTLVGDKDDCVLHYACKRGNTSIVQYLIPVCDMNKRGQEGRTPVMVAAWYGQKDVFDLLVSNAADLTLVDDNDNCVLHYACQGGNTSIVQHLITVCNINKRGRDGRTPVMSAALFGQKDVFDLLVSNAADLTLVDDDDDCVLLYACQGGNTSIVQHLITVCDINTRGRDGRTPVMSAALFGQKDVFDLLVSNAADLTLVDDKDDCVLHYACKGGNTSIVQHLITVCDINKRGQKGRTSVMVAALCGYEDVFDLLVSSAADLTLVDDNHNHVFNFAREGGNTYIVQYIISVCDNS